MRLQNDCSNLSMNHSDVSSHPHRPHHEDPCPVLYSPHPLLAASLHHFYNTVHRRSVCLLDPSEDRQEVLPSVPLHLLPLLRTTSQTADDHVLHLSRETDLRLGFKHTCRLSVRAQTDLRSDFNTHADCLPRDKQISGQALNTHASSRSHASSHELK